MSDDAIAEPSLLLARHDTAHREHHHRPHQHEHQKLHRRQTDTGAAVVTEIVATVSVIQQVDVDSNGNTLLMVLVPAPTDYSPVLTDSLPATSVPTVNNADSTASSTSNSPGQSVLSLSPSQSATDAPTSTPLISSSFSSLIASSNSTTLISSSSSLSQTFSNSTLSSSRTSLTYFTSSTSASSDKPKTKATSSPNYSSSSTYAASSDGGGFIAGGTATGSGVTPSSTDGSKSGSGSNSGPATPTPVIIGSVVSSVAGAAVIILAVLFIWRWRKRTRNMVSLGSISGAAGGSPEPITRGPPSQRPGGGMSERRSFVHAVPAALAGLTGYKRFSQKTERTISSTAGSEKGFYRVSGRKLPSVFQSGGDGYGGGIDDINTQTLSGSSFYQDSQGFYGGPGSPTVPPIQRDSGVPVMRPSPARTPVTEQGPFSSLPPPPLAPPTRPDFLGRSHPSQDGSHASRFTEEV